MKMDLSKLHTRIIIDPKSMDQMFKSEQKQQYLVTTFGKLIFNQILPPNFPYLNEPSDNNLEHGTPDIYFIKKGVNPKDVLKDIPVPGPFTKNSYLKLLLKYLKNFTLVKHQKCLTA